MIRRKIWWGSFYLRGGKLNDKHRNTYRKPISYRQKKTGIVISPKGKFITIESPYKHHYGYDKPIRKVKKPKRFSTFVKSNRIGSLKPRTSHIRQL